MLSTHFVNIFGALSKWLLNLQIHISTAAALCINVHSQLSFHKSAYLMLYWNPGIMPILSKKKKMVSFSHLCTRSQCYSLLITDSFSVAHMLSRYWFLLESTQYPQQPDGLWRSVLLFLFPYVFHSLLRIALFSFIFKNTAFSECARHTLPFWSSLRTLGYNW